MVSLRERDFPRWYQEHCDRLYWSRGQCCAGCDHWRSDMGDLGECVAAGIMSGGDVMRSLGITWSSHPFDPGFPYTKASDHCGLFRDEFDWTQLDALYLRRIGAIVKGRLQPKPSTPVQV